jgi:phosphoribosyl-AMP cyclohydrolase
MNQNLLWVEKLQFNNQDLIPAIAQDYRDGTVLMMAWMNSESIQKTLSTGEAHYWSRSRSQLWHKGATSGHIQKVKELFYDCDGDTILLKVEQIGDIACHTGARSCFFNAVQIYKKNSELRSQNGLNAPLPRTSRYALSPLVGEKN